MAEFIGVEPDRLRNRRTIDRARPYRHAIWFILSKDFDLSHRWMAEYFKCSRNTIKYGVKQFDDPDTAHIVALRMVRAKLNRVSTGV